MGFFILVGFSGRPRGPPFGAHVPLVPRGGGRAVLGPGSRRRGPPLGTSCVRGKMAARRPRAGSSKWRTRRHGRAGRVSHPHKGKGPLPSQLLLLPVTPWCARQRPGTSVSSRGLLSGASSCWGRGLSDGVSPHLVGGDESWASLALVVILLGICPLSLDRGLFSNLWFGDFQVFPPRSPQFRCSENHR